jgi:hypothetical protein
MKKLIFILVTGLICQPMLAMTNLVLVGGQPMHTSTTGDQPPVWVPYLFPLIFFLAGVIQFFYPQVAWNLKMLGKRWEYGGDIEPSDLWLFFARLGGLGMVGLSVLLFITVRSGSTSFPFHK